MNSLKIVTVCFLTLVIFSCKKVIEIKETDFINESLAFKTVENTDQGAVGAYSAVIGEGNMYVSSILSDEVVSAEFPSQDATVVNWIYGADDITLTRDNTNTYGINYSVINRANRVLAALPATDSTRAGDNQLRNRLRGEMLALRAFMHFELFRWYCDNYSAEGIALPYMEAPALTDQARIGMKPYFDKMIADFAEARTLIPASYRDSLRITRTAVIGMQARMALYMRDWANAETYATEFINLLPLSTRANFTGIWKDTNSDEVAFKLRRTNLTLRPGSFYRTNSTNATNLQTILFSVSSKLWDAYDQTNDIRFSAYMKDEPLLAVQNRVSHIVRKYEGTGYGTASDNVQDYKMIRTGEMYLIRAEARAELNKIPAASQDLNDLRKARISNYTTVNYDDKATLISLIMNERFKELAFEGHRFWDLKRRNLPVERRPADAQTVGSVTLPANNLRFVLPIPFYEIQANRAIKQNAGY